jgi:Tol biopolymer transport system component
MTSARIALTLLAAFGTAASNPLAAPRYSDWATPLNLGATINSTFNDFGAATSKDGLHLYFTSDRPGGFGANDIWVSERSSLDSPWGVPINLGPVVNTSAIDAVPFLSRDEHWLFFNSNRDGGFGANDIWVSYRTHTKDDFGWEPPINLGSGVNTAFFDQGASYVANEDGGAPMLFFGSDRPGGLGFSDIYASELQADGSFGPAQLVVQLSSPAGDLRPSVRFDGLEVIFFSPRPGSIGNADLWGATRDSIFDPWSTPTNLGATVNSTAQEQNPHLAPDRRTLYFASDRSGGFGQLDLYVSTRTKLPD